MEVSFVTDSSAVSAPKSSPARKKRGTGGRSRPRGPRPSNGARPPAPQQPSAPPPQLPTDWSLTRASLASNPDASLAEPAEIPRKRARYAAHKAPSSSAAPSSFPTKRDPAKAPALPRTLPLESKSPSADVFAAEKFSELALQPALQRQLAQKLQLERMTPVQRQAIPALLAGRDVLVRSPTGSGKTLAYAVPLVQALLAQSAAAGGDGGRAAGTRALVVVPTRELATQSHEVLQALCPPWLVTSCLTGGERKKSEKARLRKGVGVLVATPGRVADHLRSTAAFVVSACQLLVLDEADLLLELGFRPALDEIITALDERAAPGAPRRQSALLSATLPAALKDLAGRSLTDPVTVNASAAAATAVPAPKKRAAAGDDGDGDGSDDDAGDDAGDGDDEALEAPAQLLQSYVSVPAKQRLTALIGFLRSRCSDGAACKLLVFLSSCDAVDFHYELLSRATLPSLRAAYAAAGQGEADGDDGDDGDDDGDGGGDGGGARLAVGEVERDCALVGTRLYRLHGRMSQQRRAAAFGAFRAAGAGVLLCTDVAARGLNLRGVHWIVQYDLPQQPKEYVHRVGRTARLGQVGQALLFTLPSEAPFLDVLRGGGMALSEVPFASLQAALCARGASRHDIFLLELALQKRLEARVTADPALAAAAAAAFTAYVRAYATHASKADSRRVLHVGQLHLGHLAKAFALKEQPTAVVRQQGQRLDAKAKMRKRKGLPLAERLKKTKPKGGAGGRERGIGDEAGAALFSRDEMLEFGA